MQKYAIFVNGQIYLGAVIGQEDPLSISSNFELEILDLNTYFALLMDVPRALRAWFCNVCDMIKISSMNLESIYNTLA